MMLILILPWFPIVLSAAVGARLVGPSRANWLGITCALFWVVVVQMTTGEPFWSDAAMAAALLAGSAAIFGMAAWSGQMDQERAKPEASGGTSETRNGPTSAPHSLPHHFSIPDVIARFDDWLEANRLSVDAWAAFDEFIRGVLHATCGATHVRPYRVLSEGDTMLPLREIDRTSHDDMASARTGIIGHVATTGRSFHEQDTAQGELVLALASQSPSPPVWCFAIRRGARTIGLITVGQLASHAPSRDVLLATEALISQFWLTLGEVCRGRSAATTDATSGVLTRKAFLEEACHAAEESYLHGEPIAMVVITIEGLRSLVDQGRWELESDVVYEACRTMRERVRPDDLLGRFDDARFLILLRRVDSELASLISNQLIERLTRIPVMDSVPAGRVGIRCGVTGSGNRAPGITTLVADAIRLCHEARARGEQVASDLRDDRSPVSPAASTPVAADLEIRRDANQATKVEEQAGAKVT